MKFRTQNAKLNSRHKIMDMKSVCFCVLVLSIGTVWGQYSDSPCPGVFEFENYGGNVYGKITLQPRAPVSSIHLGINFTIAAPMTSNYAGRIEVEDGNTHLIKYNRGEPVSYRVHFPVTSPLPKLTAITVNGDTICYGPGDVPRPNRYVTTLSLQHTSYLRTGGAVFPNFPPQSQQRPQPQQRPQARPDPVLEFAGNFGDDDAQAHVYTFNNIEPTWSSGNSPFYAVNNSRPFTQSTQPVYQPPTQDYQESNRPTYDQDEYYNQNPTFETRPQKPNRPSRPNRPVFEPVTRRPVYEPPATRPPPQPVSDDTLYYPDRATDPPRPVQTQRPVYRQPDAPIAPSVECGIVAGGNEKIPLIYNGKSYAKGDIPWLVAIYKSQGGTLTFICGGSLVSNRHIVTAAHCMQRRSELTDVKDFVVKVGVHHLNDWSDIVTRTVISAAIHESYNPSTLENDILIFTFDKRVEFTTYIRPVCLWSGNTELSRIVGASGVVAGWGDQAPGGVGGQGEPHMVRVPIVSTAACRASKPSFHQLTSMRTLCAGDRNGAGPCLGDSGGGLYLLEGGRWRLRGVVSVSLRAANGDNTCNLNEYIIFTDTAQYLPWIRSVISENYYD